MLVADRSVFDIIGPVMIGPSSSHTAGAARIGRLARAILDEKPSEAEITLFGSFAETYRGHGTDRALVAGILGFNSDDSRIKEALALALAKRLAVTIESSQLAHAHPNTARIRLTGVSGKQVTIEGVSVGGGNIVINRINHYDVWVTGKNPTLLVEHADKPGLIGKVTATLGSFGINIAEMRMARTAKGANNFMVIETDQGLSEDLLKVILELPDVVGAIKLEAL